jgi:hypothetical protein
LLLLTDSEKLATHVSVFERAASDGTQLLENNAYLDASLLALPLAAAAASAQPPATLHAMWLQDLHVWHTREHARRSLALQKFRADFGVSEMRRWSDAFGATCIDRAAVDLMLSRATGRPRFAD